MTTRSGLHPKGAKLRANVGVAVPANSSSRIIRFSTFEVNLQTGELRQQGQKVKLQEQPFQVLAALLERPGEVVSREVLWKLWEMPLLFEKPMHSLASNSMKMDNACGSNSAFEIHVFFDQT